MFICHLHPCILRSSEYPEPCLTTEILLYLRVILVEITVQKVNEISTTVLTEHSQLVLGPSGYAVFL